MLAQLNPRNKAALAIAKIGGSTISGLSLIVLSMDYFVTDIFKMEFIFFFLLASLLLANILRLTIRKFYDRHWISISINVLLCAVLIYSFIPMAFSCFWGCEDLTGLGKFVFKTLPNLDIILGCWAMLTLMIRSAQLITRKKSHPLAD